MQTKRLLSCASALAALVWAEACSTMPRGDGESHTAAPVDASTGSGGSAPLAAGGRAATSGGASPGGSFATAGRGNGGGGGNGVGATGGNGGNGADGTGGNGGGGGNRGGGGNGAGRTGSGGNGAGGAGRADDGGPPSCTVPLERIPYCPPTYDAALATVTCPPTVDRPSIGLCGELRLFGYGHDGYTTCAYEPSSGALVGATSCGIPPLFDNVCSCHAGGEITLTSCTGPLTDACKTDAGTH